MFAILPTAHKTATICSFDPPKRMWLELKTMAGVPNKCAGRNVENASETESPFTPVKTI